VRFGKGTRRVDGWDKEVALLRATLGAAPAAKPVPHLAQLSSEGFFGVGTGGRRRIVFVLDRSGSMVDSIDFLKCEVKRAVRALDSDVAFHVVFFSSGPPVEMPTKALVSATDANKESAARFIDSIIAHGQTDPSEALRIAFAREPDVIYLLTDGEFDPAIAPLIRRLNPGGNVAVHTVGFIYDAGEPLLERIARENGGLYRFVSEAELTNLRSADDRVVLPPEM
jgi:uncharacterized protein with von Willebrand factor type A (vWA) domain